jgi:hypothetical protein
MKCNIETTMKPYSFSALGNAVHVASLVSALVFAFCTVHFFQSDVLFDAEWRKQGFCVTHADTPYLTSHDLCLYLDTVLAILFGIVYLFLYKSPGMESANALVKFNIVGLLGHGIGHGLLAQAMRDGKMEPDGAGPMDENTLTDNWVVHEAGLLIFWLSLLKSSMSELNMVYVFVFAQVAQAVSISIVPLQLRFTYVQTVLFLAFSVNQLSRPKKSKDFEYALYPALVGLPLTVIGWLESTQCSSPLVQTFQGHVIYEAYIPISAMVFYFVCYRHQSKLQHRG